MEVYLLVLFTVIVISFITGVIIEIHNRIIIKKRIKNINNDVLGKTIRLDVVENFGLMLKNNNNRSFELQIEPVNKKPEKEDDPLKTLPIVTEELVEETIEII